jgi:hypothetical protein
MIEHLFVITGSSVELHVVPIDVQKSGHFVLRGFICQACYHSNQ